MFLAFGNAQNKRFEAKNVRIKAKNIHFEALSRCLKAKNEGFN